MTEWKLGVVKSWSEADDFHFIEFPCEINEGESISQNDLLLLSKEKVLLVIRDFLISDFELFAYFELISYQYLSLHSFWMTKDYLLFMHLPWWNMCGNFLKQGFFELDSILPESSQILIQIMYNLAPDCLTCALIYARQRDSYIL